MLIGYVSDDRYVALADVLLEFEGESGSFETRSWATGSVHLDLTPGTYRVTLQKPGFGAKSVHVPVGLGRPLYQFRLLTDGLLGYAWPKWVKAGDQSEFRVHSVEPYQLSLWRYGIRKEFVRSLGWFDEHGPRATMQITPDGDYTRTGVAWNKFGYANPHLHQYVVAPTRSGLYYFHARTARGAEFAFPWIVAPARPSLPVAVLASNITWNAYNNFGGRSNYINPDQLPPTPTVNARLDLKRYTDPDSITYDTEDYAPAIVRSARADQPHRGDHGDHRPDRRPLSLSSRAGRVEATRMARTRAVRLRLLRRDPAPRGHAGPRRLQSPDPFDASRILVAGDVLPSEVVGERAGRPAHVPRR